MIVPDPATRPATRGKFESSAARSQRLNELDVRLLRLER